MRYLLDTHTLIWAIYDSDNIAAVLDILEDPNNEIFYSALNIWEISIKHDIDKLEMDPERTALLADTQGFKELPINSRHTSRVLSLRYKEDSGIKHKDPFDMLLISQAKEDGMFLLTRDRKIWKAYDEPCILKYK